MKTWVINYLVDVLPTPIEGFYKNDVFAIAHASKEKDRSLAVISLKVKTKVTEKNMLDLKFIQKIRSQGRYTLSLFLGSHSLLHLNSPTIIWELQSSISDENYPLYKQAETLAKFYPLKMMVESMDGMTKTQAMQELEESNKLFNKLQTFTHENQYICNAIFFFFRGISVNELLEDFVMLMTALEILFAGKKIKRYVSNRASKLFKEAEQEKMQGRLKGLYEKRSELVHGNEVSISYNDKFFLEKIVKTSLNHFIICATKGMQRNEILESIDEL